MEGKSALGRGPNRRELGKLGYKVSPRTVAKYRPPHLPRNRGQSWPTFVRNHLHQTWACDFLTIVTLRFQILYCFVIVDLARREIVHIGVTSSPSAQYAGQCFVEAVADRDNENPRFMIRDRDSIYGKEFRRRVKSCGTRCLITPPRSPKANAICERLNGTLRRDCLDHIIVIDDVHADRVLKEYVPLLSWPPPSRSSHAATARRALVAARATCSTQGRCFSTRSSVGSITSIALGSPEIDRRSAVDGRHAGTRFVRPRSLLSRVRAPDPGALRPQSGAAQPSPRPILAAVSRSTRLSIGIIAANRWPTRVTTARW